MCPVELVYSGPWVMGTDRLAGAESWDSVPPRSVASAGGGVKN
jgi:hypothetical protein